MFKLLIVDGQYDYSKMFDFAISLGIKVEFYRRDKVVREDRVVTSFDGRKFDFLSLGCLGQNPQNKDCVWLEDQLESLWLKHKGENSLPKLTNDYDYADYLNERLYGYKKVKSYINGEIVYE